MQENSGATPWAARKTPAYFEKLLHSVNSRPNKP
jgi:hypothetical protein